MRLQLLGVLFGAWYKSKDKGAEQINLNIFYIVSSNACMHRLDDLQMVMPVFKQIDTFSLSTT